MILVTGASGWVGSAVCAELARRGLPFRAALRRLPAPLPAADALAVGDVDGATDWSRALVGVQAVVHLAARVHVMRDVAADPVAAFRAVNRDGTRALAQQAAAAGVKRLVLVSSVKVLGESTPAGAPFTEASPPAPQDAYGLSKWEAEQALWSVCAHTGLQGVVVRPPLVFGPGAKANLAALAQAVRRGWPLPLSRVDNRRSLVGLSNLVDFLLACATREAAAGQTYLIAEDADWSTPELIRRMAQAAGQKARLWPLPVAWLQAAGRWTGRSAAVERLCGNLQIDSTKARIQLGWNPVSSADAELVRMMAHGSPQPAERC